MFLSTIVDMYILLKIMKLIDIFYYTNSLKSAFYMVFQANTVFKHFRHREHSISGGSGTSDGEKGLTKRVSE